MKYIIALFAFFLMNCSSDVNGDILYHPVEPDKDGLAENLAIDEDKAIIVQYSDPFTDEYFTPGGDDGRGSFKYQVNNSVIYDAGTKISIPKNIENNKTWKYKNISCSAMKKLNNYLINCERYDDKWSYTYSEKLGITSFDSPCYVFEKCKYRKYKLVSKKGIFSYSSLKNLKNY